MGKQNIRAAVAVLFSIEDLQFTSVVLYYLKIAGTIETDEVNKQGGCSIDI